MKKQKTHEVVTVEGNQTVTKVLDSQNNLVSAKIVTTNDNTVMTVNHDSSWKVTGATYVTTLPDKIITETFNAKMKVVSSEVVRTVGNETWDEHYLVKSNGEWDLKYATHSIDLGDLDFVQIFNHDWKKVVEYNFNETTHRISDLHVDFQQIFASGLGGFDLF